MDLNRLYSSKRTGIDYSESQSDPRSGYQRDYDRIIFSSAFRRLQNKTQVFPLPGSVFVHNRLTHSLEVSSVGRSLGHLVGKYIYENFNSDLNDDSKRFYRNHLKNVLAAACLCHDIGNPAFGHSGEDAIAKFFVVNSKKLIIKIGEKEYNDLTSFEGNANSIRVLTQQLAGKSKGGLRLTYSTLAAIAKYPCEASAIDNRVLHRKKFGFLQSEKEVFGEIATNTGMALDTSCNKLAYLRHPFVWLVEAADDICYNIVDLEDAHRLKIIENSHCEHLLKYLVECLGVENMQYVDELLSEVSDKNDRISYLRAKAINSLIFRIFDLYKIHFTKILKGTLEQPLFDLVARDCDAIKEIQSFSIENIYNDRSVVEIENAGYNVMNELLNHFIFPILEVNKHKSDKKAIRLIPKQFIFSDTSDYRKVLGVLDYLSGMTDLYAAELYKKIKGIEIGMRN